MLKRILDWLAEIAEFIRCFGGRADLTPVVLERACPYSDVRRFDVRNVGSVDGVVNAMDFLATPPMMFISKIEIKPVDRRRWDVFAFYVRLPMLAASYQERVENGDCDQC